MLLKRGEGGGGCATPPLDPSLVLAIFPRPSRRHGSSFHWINSLFCILCDWQ